MDSQKINILGNQSNEADMGEVKSRRVNNLGW